VDDLEVQAKAPQTERPQSPQAEADRTESDQTPRSDTSALTDMVIITGFSGAGKSTAMAAFEDEGYFCVDNLPSEMIRSLVDLFMHAGSKVRRAAVVSDVRGGSYFDGLAVMLDDLRASGVKHRVLFLDADEQTLLTRYKETRRRHPLAPTGTVTEGIARERELLRSLRGRADVVIDTTGLTAAMLRRKLADEMMPSRTPGRLAVTFQSFGFKYGPARDPDLLLDVRFLPNPHYEPDLRPLTGDDPRIVGFIDRDGELTAFYERLHPLIDYLLPQYLAEGKAHLVVAIGCTGGRHRSVAIASHLAVRYNPEPEYLVHVVHRDVTKPA
jgi:RNase adapter protein RapZ